MEKTVGWNMMLLCDLWLKGKFTVLVKYLNSVLQQFHITQNMKKYIFHCRNSMNYKQDMDAKLFEKFLHETCRLLREKYGDKVALVMDNASYHTVMVR